MLCRPYQPITGIQQYLLAPGLLPEPTWHERGDAATLAAVARPDLRHSDWTQAGERSPFMTLLAFRGTISWKPATTTSDSGAAASQGFRSRPRGGLRPLTLYVPTCKRHHQNQQPES